MWQRCGCCGVLWKNIQERHYTFDEEKVEPSCKENAGPADGGQEE